LSGRIEGGVDAVVLGANADGLVAAAYLRKAGLKTVLLEAGANIGGVIAARNFADGRECVDGEHLIFALDPVMIDDIDLYRFGVSYSARRLDTSYFFEDGRMLKVSGDLQNAAHELADFQGAERLEAFVRDVLDMGVYLRPAFHDPMACALEKTFASAPPAMAQKVMRYALAPAIEILDDWFEDGLIKTALLSEACFRSAAAPDEAFSFLGLVRRWAGETAGLQGAVAYAKGGATAVIQALRRAAQAAKVDIRAATRVKSILIEYDRVAGVELDGGGQIRAPIIVAAQNARRVFIDLIGPANLDLNIQKTASAPRPDVSTAQLSLALNGIARDEKTKDNMRRRLVFAPEKAALRRAFAEARAGRVPASLIVEALFSSTLDENEGDEKRQTLSLMAHPLPADDLPSKERRGEIQAAILGNLEQFAPDIGSAIEAADLRLAADFADQADSAAIDAKPGVLQQWALAASIKMAGRISGLYFCGPESQIGVGLSGSAGRAAAVAAIRAAKRGEVNI
jgi:phytoene dehydrogenase-like protein